MRFSRVPAAIAEDQGHHSTMSDYTTSDAETNPDEPTEPAGSETIDPENGKSTNDWMVPAALLGGVVVVVAVFIIGFAIGRATGDDGQAVASDPVVVQVHRQGPDTVLPEDGFRFFDFGQRGPGGQFDMRNLEELPNQILDRLCGLLDDGRIPEQAPFADQLAEMCRSTNS